jgi:tRNA threonylcarbamoyladenosine biosynthesis protein TsaB
VTRATRRASLLGASRLRLVARRDFGGEVRYASGVRILAIDTSSELCSVGVCAGGEILSELASRAPARHGETLLPLIGEAIARSGLTRASIDAIAVGIGPGSFTGTRIGVATAKGLAVALDRPIAGIVSLHAIARAAPGAWIAPAIDAHKGEVYAALYQREDGALIERVAPAHAVPERAREALLAAGAKVTACGSGYRRYPALGEGLDVLAPIWDAPRAPVLALIAAEQLASRGPDDRAALEPLYLRPSDAKLPG